MQPAAKFRWTKYSLLMVHLQTIHIYGCRSHSGPPMPASSAFGRQCRAATASSALTCRPEMLWPVAQWPTLLAVLAQHCLPTALPAADSSAAHRGLRGGRNFTAVADAAALVSSRR